MYPPDDCFSPSERGLDFGRGRDAGAATCSDVRRLDRLLDEPPESSRRRPSSCFAFADEEVPAPFGGLPIHGAPVSRLASARQLPQHIPKYTLTTRSSDFLSLPSLRALCHRVLHLESPEPSVPALTSMRAYETYRFSLLVIRSSVKPERKRARISTGVQLSGRG